MGTQQLLCGDGLEDRAAASLRSVRLRERHEEEPDACEFGRISNSGGRR